MNSFWTSQRSDRCPANTFITRIVCSPGCASTATVLSAALDSTVRKAMTCHPAAMPPDTVGPINWLGKWSLTPVSDLQMIFFALWDWGEEQIAVRLERTPMPMTFPHTSSLGGELVVHQLAAPSPAFPKLLKLPQAEDRDDSDSRTQAALSPHLKDPVVLQTFQLIFMKWEWSYCAISTRFKKHRSVSDVEELWDSTTMKLEAVVRKFRPSVQQPLQFVLEQ